MLFIIISMSLPSKYQKEITDKIINDFPELIFNKDNTILKKDEFFNLYVKIIKNASKIELKSVSGVPKSIINKVYDFFNSH